MTRASIHNATKGVVLHDRPQWALSGWRQAIGFMFRRPGKRALIMLFLPPRRERIHMFFVRGPLDLVALDGNGSVMDLRPEISPWQTWKPKEKMYALLELPAGTIARTNTEVGDSIRLPQPPL